MIPEFTNKQETTQFVRALFDRLGGREYSGEPVSQLEHALQSAQLAEQHGAERALILAALLHDIGHLINDLGETPTLKNQDDKHEFFGAKFLKNHFGDAVSEPVKYHVAAKRYLCFARQGYFESLSADSVRSLQLQGGIFTAEQANEFIQIPFAGDAVNLRIWDDLAKKPNHKTPNLEYYLQMI